MFQSRQLIFNITFLSIPRNIVVYHCYFLFLIIISIWNEKINIDDPKYTRKKCKYLLIDKSF